MAGRAAAVGWPVVAIRGAYASRRAPSTENESMSTRSLDIEWRQANRDGTHLACAEFSAAGSSVMLLHGLAGTADEWSETADALTSRYRVLAPDQRGHGRSERHPPDVSRDAYVNDVVMWIERLAAAPTVLVGQSLGGHTAFVVAARRPDLVCALVVVEATPQANPRGRDDVRRWLETWPRSFVSEEAARRFFGDTPWGRAWLRGLESRRDGIWPRFDVDVMVESLRETSENSYWDDWSQIACPTLIVRGEDGIPPSDVDRMLASVSRARAVTIQGAGHDAHLERPDQWNAALRAFLDDVGGSRLDIHKSGQRYT
jgi:pimeloyl-ACP methyl ester carboxylesterase